MTNIKILHIHNIVKPVVFNSSHNISYVNSPINLYIKNLLAKIDRDILAVILGIV